MQGYPQARYIKFSLNLLEWDNHKILKNNKLWIKK